MDKVNYPVQKDWEALHFVMRVHKKKGKKCIVYTSLLRPILEYWSACWDPYKGHIKALDRVQEKGAQFTNHTKECDWETVAQRRRIAR